MQLWQAGPRPLVANTPSIPLVELDSSTLVVAAGRVDNRREIATNLNLSPGALSSIPDHELIAFGWRKWGTRLFDYLVGDCALAAWEAKSASLSLVRSPLSSVGLYWHQSRDDLSFATDPNVLLETADAFPKPDVDALVTSYTDNDVPLGQRTPFQNLNVVPPGRALVIERDRQTGTALWEPGSQGTTYCDLRDASDALRNLLDLAVEARLDRIAGTIAAELSSGRDSSAVTTSAALLLSQRGKHLLALTGAPKTTYNDQSGGRWRSDESGLAALTASQHPNIDHVICRTTSEDPLPWLDHFNAVQILPARGLNNLPWQIRVRQEARTAGASVLLRGGHGNWTISAGGQFVFSDVVRERGLRGALVAAAAYAGSDPRHWWNAIHLAVGPYLPRLVYRALARARGHRSPFRPAPFLRQPYRSMVEDIRREAAADIRPFRSYRERMRSYVSRAHSTDHFSWSCFGLETRDPTADRRVVDHILAQPITHLLSTMDRRPMYELAFGSRIPEAVLHARPNGMPGEDWMLSFAAADLDRTFARYGEHQLVSEWIDIKAARAALAEWPRKSATAEQYSLFVHELLNSLSLASFLRVRFGS